MIAVPTWVERYRRIPYVDKGRSHAGVDCYGLVWLVQREQFGRALPDYVYTSSQNAGSVAAVMREYLPRDWHRVDAPQLGDLVELKILGRPWHCGVWVAPQLMLHAIDGRDSGIERLDRVQWHARGLGFHRPRIAA